MAATTRWTLYDITASGIAGDGGGEEGLGTRAYSRADASVGDTFSIGAGNNRLYTNLDGSAQYVTLTSGVGLDPRFVAKDVTERLHNLGLAAAGYSMAQCVWENNKLMLYSGSTGTGSSATVTSGTNTAHLELGWGTKTDVGGQATSNTYSSGNSGITVSGTYNGFLDEMYHIVMTKDLAINTPTKGGSNSYTGVLTTGGVYNGASTLTYTLDIDVTNGTTMGAGTGNVPTVDWVSTGSADDNTGDPLELLYPNYWYKIGTRGLMVKFTDAVFNTCNPAWTILCDQPQYVVGSNAQAPAGSAKYVWSSTRGDDATTSVVTSAAGTSRLGSRGLTISFNGSGNFNVGDEFFVICKPPQPSSYDISSLNYGNVTVSTESPVKPVLFEILSGATEVSTIKFGLQSHGNFDHHSGGDDDTFFRFGTMGPGNNAGTGDYDGYEWKANIAASDIDSDTPPYYLYATKANLAVVTDADSSESLGSSAYSGMLSDVIWLCIKLGSSEVGANSGVNFRVFFDYS